MTLTALDRGHVVGEPPYGDASRVGTDGVRHRVLRRPRLAQRRIAMGLTQEDLAEALGVDRTTPIRWECPSISRSGDVSRPLPVYRPKLARALEVSLDELDEILSDIVYLDDHREVTPVTPPPGPGSPSVADEAALSHEHSGSLPTECSCALTTVAWWSGREASALRRALRLSVRAFAEHLGTSARTVASWEDRCDLASPGLAMQRALDSALVQADSEARIRFRLILLDRAAAGSGVTGASTEESRQ
jgi:transcriptional regulator with XRE-family HTH domain